jgi:hypothetical protein
MVVGQPNRRYLLWSVDSNFSVLLFHYDCFHMNDCPTYVGWSIGDTRYQEALRSRLFLICFIVCHAVYLLYDNLADLWWLVNLIVEICWGPSIQSIFLFPLLKTANYSLIIPRASNSKESKARQKAERSLRRQAQYQRQLHRAQEIGYQETAEQTCERIGK